MTIHVLHGGGGYTYLTRQTAAHDQQLGRGDSLADYYTAHGHPAGRWRGSGAAELGLDGTVSEAQMRALFGEGRHPDTDVISARLAAAGESPEAIDKATRLGRKPPSFKVADSLIADLGEAYRRANVAAGRPAGSPLPAGEKEQIRRDVTVAAFRSEHGRNPSPTELARYSGEAPSRNRDQVAGYDLVFTPVKSVSVLWALSSDDVRREVWAAHNAAVSDTMQWIERTAIYTRAGAGGVAQVDTKGLLTTEFVHFDSRAGDPDLHTHVAIANKVQGVDGKWRSIDGRALFPAAVAASERYNSRIEDELRQRLGVEFVDAGRQIREVAGVPKELIDGFSKRRRSIEQRYDEAVADHVRQHGRQPTKRARWKLYQQATLTERTDKDQPRSLREMIANWRAEADRIGGRGLVDQLETRVRAEGPRKRGEALPSKTEAAAELLDRVSATRSTWTVHNLRAEAERIARGWAIQTGGRDQVVEDLVAAATSPERSVLLSAPATVDDPDQLRRADGVSVFETANRHRWTTQRILDAEQRIVAAGREATAWRANPVQVGAAIVARAELTEGQQNMVRSFTESGRRADLALAAAGTGKTTAVKVAADIWQQTGHQVVALAPTAAAAKVLGAEVGVSADTIHAHLLANRDLAPGTMIVVDEAGMVPTLLLDRLLERAHAQDLVVRLIGDDRQLGSVEGGGAVRLFAHDNGAIELDEVKRFRDPAEAAATLQLRSGDPAAVDWYERAQRIHEGERGDVVDAAFDAWTADLAAGRNVLLLAGDNRTVTELNERARAARVAAGEVTVDGFDGRGTVRIGVGDHVATRKNNRELVVNGGRDWVKNGDGWVVEKITRAGAVNLRHRDHGGRIQVDADYASAHLDLDYARTVHRAQGLTVDRAHLIADDSMTRGALYVGASRGRESNQLWVATHESVAPDHVPDVPAIAREILGSILASSDVEDSATQVLRDELDQAASLPRMLSHLDHAAGVLTADHYRDLAVKQGIGDVVDHPVWNSVVAQLRAAERDGWQIERIMPRLAIDLDDAADRGAVVAWRVQQLRQQNPPPPIATPTRADIDRYSDTLGLDAEQTQRWAPVWMTVKAGEVAGCDPAPLLGALRSAAQKPAEQDPRALGRTVGRQIELQLRRDQARSLVPPWLPAPARYSATPAAQALAERRQEISTRIRGLVDDTVAARPAWARTVPVDGEGTTDRTALAWAIAYREQYRITDDGAAGPLGPRPDVEGRQQRAWDTVSRRWNHSTPPTSTNPPTGTRSDPVTLSPAPTVSPNEPRQDRRGPTLR